MTPRFMTATFAYWAYVSPPAPSRTAMLTLGRHIDPGIISALHGSDLSGFSPSAIPPDRHSSGLAFIGFAV